MKIVKKLDSVAQLSMKAKITMLEELTGIEDGETLTKEILAQGVTLENVAMVQERSLLRLKLPANADQVATAFETLRLP